MTATYREALRALLWVEPLEPRATPTASGPDRVLVTFVDPDADHLAALTHLPLATSVSRVTAGVYRVDLASGTAVAAAVADLGRLPGVAAARPDALIAPERTARDPGASGQWGLAKVGAPAAWDRSVGTGAIVVAVIDTGVDYAHPDLAANMWRNPGEIAGNGRDDDGDGFVDDVCGADFRDNDGDPMDDAGHGTHVAGIIGARGDNGLGVAGVAWQTRIMALRFMSAAGGYTSDAVRAVEYAVAHGAKVINASWGGPAADPALAAAFARARAAGVIVVVAAGNGGANVDASPFYPAGYARQYDNVVSVAATDRSDRLAGFSNFGAATVTVAAPGVGIQSTLPRGRYGSMSGTSMATPFVTGAVALFWGTHPGWTYQAVIARLRESAAGLPALSGKVAAGRLDLGRMFDLSPPPADTTSPHVVSSTFGGPHTGVFDRVRVRFGEPINPAALVAAGATGNGPLGLFRVSAITPVAGTNNTEFLLMFSRPQTAAGVYTVAVGSFLRATATLGASSTPPAADAVHKTYAAPALPRAIQDRRTTRIDIVVNEDFRVADLNVQFVITHARTHDLSIRVVAPDGHAVTLFNRRGSGANLAGTVFDDAATVGVGSAAAPFTGSVRPEQALALFNGMNARGVWSVQIFDLADGAAGAVNDVRLAFTPQASAPGTELAAAEFQTLREADLMGADDLTRTAVLDGRGEEPTRSPGLTMAAPVRVGWCWFGEPPAPATSSHELSISLARREGLPLTPVIAEPPADPWADLPDDFGPIRV